MSEDRCQKTEVRSQKTRRGGDRRHETRDSLRSSCLVSRVSCLLLWANWEVGAVAGFDFKIAI